MWICRQFLVNFSLISKLRKYNLITNSFRKSSQSNSLSTIYALSSGYGKCGVAVIRISGPKSREAIARMTENASIPTPRLAVCRKFVDPKTNEILDRGLLIWFPGPRSFTGEDCCEFHVHGGVAVVTAILTALGKLPGYRPAEAGEFTRRAFNMGKLDLTEVEGLGDLIEAETEVQRKQALLQMEGTLSHLYNTWRQTLIQSVAHVEAYIDFGEDENIEDDVMKKVDQTVSELQKSIRDHLSRGKCGERLRDGVRTVIIGEPNVGKSSLLNAMCQRPAAIVTPVAGTTRDIIELHLNIGGYPVLLLDTAGLHSGSQDEVEMEGMKRARAAIHNSDLLLLMVDASKCVATTSLKHFVKHYVQNLGLQNIVPDRILEGKEPESVLSNHEHKQCIIILNKIDLIKDIRELQSDVARYSNVITVSCKTEDGFPQLFSTMTQNLIKLCGVPSQQSPMLTQARHRHHLMNCLSNLEKYSQFSQDENTVLAAQQLRNAVRCIGKITGHVSAEEILDVIFKEFCIGK